MGTRNKDCRLCANYNSNKRRYTSWHFGTPNAIDIGDRQRYESTAIAATHDQHKLSEMAKSEAEIREKLEHYKSGLKK
jgi:hypothetical protein